MNDFFVGITLPKDLEEEVERWRRRFAAPQTPPHITLLPPFTWTGSDDDLVKVLTASLQGKTSFPVQVRGLGHFGRGVIYIDVKQSLELTALYDTLRSELEAHGIGDLSKGKPYHPHITLATRLSPERFQAYQEELSGYSPTWGFHCHEVTLFKMLVQGRLRRWLVHRRIPLG
jgi:2'-5' RNA ligase